MSEEPVLSEENLREIALSGVFIDGDTKWHINTFVIHIGRSVGFEVEARQS